MPPTGQPHRPGRVSEPGHEPHPGGSGLLDLLVDLAACALPEVSCASVAAVAGRGRRIETLASSAPATGHLDGLQYRERQGPAVDAMTGGAEVRATVPCSRWPVFSAAAEAAGLRAVWSLPLVTSGVVAGALNLYSSQGRPWEAPRAPGARILASHAAAMLAFDRTLCELTHGNATLRLALETRTVIGQAQGVLMARQQIDAATAFDILRRASQRTNRKLRDIAAELVAGAAPRAAAAQPAIGAAG